ncbi:MAG: hypothetical protein J2P54_13470 [Bradyrhizobiaceae bacterium]|nr:hypothetical protein [Bradyrhizobiaceae bacterium]
MRRTVIAPLLLLVSGAATAVAQSANPSTLASQKGNCAVGVVSHLGEKFQVREQRGLFAEPKVSDVPVESWHLDDLVVDRIRGALGNRADVQRIPYHKEALALVEPRRDESRWLTLSRLFQFDFAAVTRRLVAGTRCARYVLVTEGVHVDADPRSLAGLGIAKGLGIIGMYVIIKAWVIDGETFKVLNDPTADARRRSTPALFGTAPLLNESFWPDPPHSAAQNAKLCEAAREMVAQDLDEILPKLLPTL